MNDYPLLANWNDNMLPLDFYQETCCEWQCLQSGMTVCDLKGLLSKTTILSISDHLASFNVPYSTLNTVVYS